MTVVIIVSILKEKWLSFSHNALTILTVMAVALFTSLPAYNAHSDEMHSTAVSDLLRFRINGNESSFNWLVAHGNNQFSAVGFLAGDSELGRMQTNDDGSFSLNPLSLLVPEEVNNVVIYHEIPFFETSDTIYEFLYDEESRDTSAIDAPIVRREVLAPPKEGQTTTLPADSDYRLIELDFTFEEDGWVRADHIRDYWNLFYLYGEHIDYANIWDYFSFDDLDHLLESEDSYNHFWLDVSSDEVSEISGIFGKIETIYVDQRFPESPPHNLPSERMILFVPFEVHGTIARHIVPIYFLSSDDANYFLSKVDLDQPMRERSITVSAVVNNDVLVAHR